MGFFKKKIKRYAELTWDYPLPIGVRMEYRLHMTSHPQDCNRNLGNGGRGYECYDLHDSKDRENFIHINLDSDLMAKALRSAGFDINSDGSLNPERYYKHYNGEI